MKQPGPHDGWGHSLRKRCACETRAPNHDSLILVPALVLIEQVGDPGLSAMIPVEVRSHEDTGAANRRLFTQALYLSTSVDLVVLEDSKLHLLVLVRDLLRLRVHFLLPLLRAAVKARGEEDSRLLLEQIPDQAVVVEAR